MNDKDKDLDIWISHNAGVLDFHTIFENDLNSRNIVIKRGDKVKRFSPWYPGYGDKNSKYLGKDAEIPDGYAKKCNHIVEWESEKFETVTHIRSSNGFVEIKTDSHKHFSKLYFCEIDE